MGSWCDGLVARGQEPLVAHSCSLVPAQHVQHLAGPWCSAGHPCPLFWEVCGELHEQEGEAGGHLWQGTTCTLACVTREVEISSVKVLVSSQEQLSFPSQG